MNSDVIRERVTRIGGVCRENMCAHCGRYYGIGEWPFCPHGFPSAGVSVISDELPYGPYWCETLGDKPVYVTSKSHLAREAAARNLECVGGRKPDSYYARQRRLQDECIRDTGKTLDGHVVRER